MQYAPASSPFFIDLVLTTMLLSFSNFYTAISQFKPGMKPHEHIIILILLYFYAFIGGSCKGRNWSKLNCLFANVVVSILYKRQYANTTSTDIKRRN